MCRRSCRSIFSALLVLAMWAAVPAGLHSPTRVEAKPGEPGQELHTSLYMLEQQYGRVLLPLHPLTLTVWAPGNPSVTIGDVSPSQDASRPTIVPSPDGSKLAVITNDCAGCVGSPARFFTVRIIDFTTGLELARFHPKVAITVSYVANDGSRIAGFPVPSLNQKARRWYTLDGRTGHVTGRLTLPGLSLCCGPALFDAAGSRLYVTDAGDAQQLSLVSYSITSGTVLGRITLDAAHFAQTGMALSPDGQRLALFDAERSTLTLIDARQMKVVSTRSISQPESILQRLTDLMGLAPTPAEAKPLIGLSIQMQFSPNGRSLYFTGTRGSLDNGQYSSSSLGIQRIDVAGGKIVAEALTGLPSLWMGQAADGSALYSLTSDREGEDYCLCTLRRLDPATLATTAQRTFDSMPQLYIIGNR